MHTTPPCECACGAASVAGTGAFSNRTCVASASASEILATSVYWFTTIPAGFSRLITIAAAPDPCRMSTEDMFPGVPLMTTAAANEVAPIETCVVPLGHTIS